MTKKYVPLATGIYLNYAIIGMATIIISQYRNSFQQLWNTNLKGISTVISMIGIGRLLTILFAGYVSDRFGRKLTMLVGIATTIIFFLGLVLSRDVVWASIFALFMGATDSFSDASSYPALSDAFTNRAASMNSLVKAAMSLAQFALPFIVAAIPDSKVALIGMTVIMVVDGIIIMRSQFGPQNESKPETKQTSVDMTLDSQNVAKSKPSVLIDGTALVVLGFTISFTFYVFTQYVPNFGISVLKVSAATAKGLVSWYAIASLISVFVTSVIVTKIKPMYLVLTYSGISLIFLGWMTLMPSLWLAQITSIVIGFFAAGGIWQLGLTILSQYFPREKGKVTGYYSFMAALTYFVGPFVSSFVINNTAASVLWVFKLDIVVTLIGVLLIALVMVRNFKYKFI